MKQIFELLFIALFTFLLFSCEKEPTSYPPESRQKCETCYTSDDCCCNMECAFFYNKLTASNRCATRQTRTCP